MPAARRSALHSIYPAADVGQKEKYLRNQLEKLIFPGVAWPLNANSSLCGAVETPWIKTGLKPCRWRRFGLYGELASESQDEKSGLTEMPSDLSRSSNHEATTELRTTCDKRPDDDH